MDYYFWFDMINLEWSIVYFKESHFKIRNCISFSEQMHNAVFQQVYSNKSHKGLRKPQVKHTVGPAKNNH